MYIENVFKYWKNHLVIGAQLVGHMFNSLLYADDMIIICESKSDLQKAAYKLQNISTDYQMTISKSKASNFTIKLWLSEVNIW